MAWVYILQISRIRELSDGHWNQACNTKRVFLTTATDSVRCRLDVRPIPRQDTVLCDVFKPQVYHQLPCYDLHITQLYTARMHGSA